MIFRRSRMTFDDALKAGKDPQRQLGTIDRDSQEPAIEELIQIQAGLPSKKHIMFQSWWLARLILSESERYGQATDEDPELCQLKILAAVSEMARLKDRDPLTGHLAQAPPRTAVEVVRKIADALVKTTHEVRPDTN